MTESGAPLDNRYRIERVLGQGGMGAVELAIDQSLGIPCAVAGLNVTVYFPHANTIIILGPLALAWLVAHSGMGTPTLQQMVVHLPRYAVSGHSRHVPRAFVDEGLENLRGAAEQTLMAHPEEHDVLYVSA